MQSLTDLERLSPSDAGHALEISKPLERARAAGDGVQRSGGESVAYGSAADTEDAGSGWIFDAEEGASAHQPTRLEHKASSVTEEIHAALSVRSSIVCGSATSSVGASHAPGPSPVGRAASPESRVSELGKGKIQSPERESSGTSKPRFWSPPLAPTA